MSNRDEEKDGKQDVEMGEEMMAMLEKELSIAEALKESLEEMDKMRKGELPKRSWRDMMEDIRRDKESGRL